jgi:sugar phosphate isomerase/epimerase
LGPIEAAELNKILDDNGIRCIVTHRNLDQIRQTEAMIEYHKMINCPYIAIGHFLGQSKKDWCSMIDEFNKLGTIYNEHGMQLGYHNHSFEFIPFADNPSKINPKDNPMHLLFERFNPSIWFEIDVYWIAHAGGDPAAWIEKCDQRIPIVHFKDMSMGRDNQQKFCEIGNGNLNWPGIIQACKKSGVQHYIIERDSGEVDPFESFEISLKNMRQMGLE